MNHRLSSLNRIHDPAADAAGVADADAVNTRCKFSGPGGKTAGTFYNPAQEIVIFLSGFYGNYISLFNP